MLLAQRSDLRGDPWFKYRPVRAIGGTTVGRQIDSWLSSARCR
jgi:hypothetical protein